MEEPQDNRRLENRAFKKAEETDNEAGMESLRAELGVEYKTGCDFCGKQKVRLFTMFSKAGRGKPMKLRLCEECYNKMKVKA